MIAGPPAAAAAAAAGPTGAAAVAFDVACLVLVLAAGYALARGLHRLAARGPDRTPARRAADVLGVLMRLGLVGLLLALPELAGPGWAAGWAASPDLALGCLLLAAAVGAAGLVRLLRAGRPS